MTDHPSLKLPNDKRIKLFQISSGEFAAKGFKQASLNRIISEMKMSKSSFYHYFKNKEDLFRVTLETVLGPALAMHGNIQLADLTAENFWTSLIEGIGEAMEVINNTPEMIMAGKMFYRCHEDPDGRAVTEEILGEFRDWVAQLIRRGQAIGVVRDDLPQSLLIDILMSVGMSMDRWMMAHWDTTSDAQRLEISQAGIAVFMRLVQPD